MVGKFQRSKFKHPDQAAFFSAESERTSPTSIAGRALPEKNSNTTSNYLDKDNLDNDNLDKEWPSLGSKGRPDKPIPLINQENHATASNATTPSQEGSSKEEAPSSPSYSADKDSSRATVDANKDNVDASATDGTIPPNKEEHGDTHLGNVDSSTTEAKIPPIIQERSATLTSNDKLPQDSSTSANTEVSSLDIKPHSSSMENPATTSSATPSQEGSSRKKELCSKLPQDSSRAASPYANIDGSPPDNGLNVAVPSSSSSRKKSTNHSRTATTSSNGRPTHQDLSTSANSIHFGSLRYDDIKGTLPSSSSPNKPSSRKGVDGSASNGTIPPMKHELSASMITSNNSGQPPQDGFTASSSSSSPSSSKDGPLLGKSRTNEPIKQEDPTTSSILEEGLSTSANTEHVETHMENVDASVALPPINQERSATISSATTSQEVSCRAASPSTNIDGSPLYDPELNVAVPSSSADKELSATNKTIPQIIQEHSFTTSNGTPPQDSSTSANIDNVDKNSSRVDADAHIDNGSRKADGPHKKGLNPDAPPFEPSSKPPQGSSTAASHNGLNPDAPPFKPTYTLPQYSSTAALTSANTQYSTPIDLSFLNEPGTPAGVFGSLTETEQVSRDIDLSRGQPLQVTHPSARFGAIGEKPNAILFSEFYFQKQKSAAKELKKRSWRYHKKREAWFQRHEVPKIVNNEYELGTYLCVDINSDGWRPRVMTDFKLEYDCLEMF